MCGSVYVFFIYFELCGAHPKSISNLHNALIPSRTLYAAPDIGIIDSNVTIFQVIHICMGLTRSTPVTAILGEAAEWPI